jgi:hypothetical protein
MDLGQYGAEVHENFYHMLNKALQLRDPETLLLLKGCPKPKFYWNVTRYCATTPCKILNFQVLFSYNQTNFIDGSDLSVYRYLHFFFGALRSLPKEPEAVFFRGVNHDAINARPAPALHTPTFKPHWATHVLV